MPKRKLTNEQFQKIVLPLILNGTPTIRELAEATGLSEGGVYYKLGRLGIRLTRRYVAVKPDSMKTEVG